MKLTDSVMVLSLYRGIMDTKMLGENINPTKNKNGKSAVWEHEPNCMDLIVLELAVNEDLSQRCLSLTWATCYH